jgi:hypothetical protein
MTYNISPLLRVGIGKDAEEELGVLGGGPGLNGVVCPCDSFLI